jgi:hypothetical protein
VNVYSNSKPSSKSLQIKSKGLKKSLLTLSHGKLKKEDVEVDGVDE